MGRRRCILLLLLFFSFSSYSQQMEFNRKKYSLEFQLFANTNINGSSLNTLKTDYHFNRTLVVFQRNLSERINFSLAGDTYVKNGDKPYVLTPYLKRLYFKYHYNGLAVSAGLLVLEQFKYQRKIWGLRYLDKTFQNEFKYGDNRGIGVLIKHDLNDRFSYDIAITSGYCTPLDHYSRG